MFILSSCNSSLGNCCNDYTIVPILNILKGLMDIIQLIVPILLIVMATYQLFALVINPDDNKGIKKITNKFLAAGIVFFLPLTVNVVLNMMPSSFSIGECWKVASNKNEIAMSSSHKYKEINKKTKSSISTNPDEYDSGSTSSSGKTGLAADSTSSAVATNGSAMGKKIASYALEFVGKPYKRGGQWNGEKPYTATDCTGFVIGVYKHFGYSMPESRDYIISHSTKVDESKAQAGDIIVYDSHYGIATGNSYQMVHAANPKDGVCITNNFRKVGKTLMGVYRYNF